MIVKRKITGGWYARLDCWKPHCWKCRDLAGNAGMCKSGVEINIPDDPVRQPWISYPRHSSTQWRDNALSLPRTDGVYTSTVESKKEVFKPRVFRDRYLAFTPEGEVLDYEAIHDGYDRERFHADAADIVTRFRTGELYSFRPDPVRWRGLYSMTGTALTCSLTEVQASGYVGNLVPRLSVLAGKRMFRRRL